MNDHLDYLTWIRAAGAAPGTVRQRRHYLGSLAETYPASTLLALTPADLAAFLAHDGWAPETRKCARAALRGFYAWALDMELTTKNPAVKLPPVRVPPGRPRPTPDDVFARAVAHGDVRDRLMVMLAAYAGLRRSEIAQVHTSDMTGDVLRVKGKGGRVRLLPLHPVLFEALLLRPEGWVFPGLIDGHLSAQYVGQRLGRLLGPGWSGHTLRHRFASRAYLVDRDLRAVQTLLGHSKPETTARYTQVPDGALRAAILGVAA